MIDELREDIRKEKELVKEISSFIYQINYFDENKEEKKLLKQALKASIERLKIINNAIPEIVNSISPYKKLEEKENKRLRREKDSSGYVTIKKKEKERYLEKLRLSGKTLKRLKKKEKKEGRKKFMEMKKVGFYGKISNRIFLNFSNKMIKTGWFDGVNRSLREANLPYLLTTYLSVTFLSTLLAFFLGITYFIFSFFFTFSLSIPELTFNYIIRNFGIMLGLPILTFLSFIFYPYGEARSVESKIEQEIPFVAIHMSAIAGSGIEPTEIFKIIATGREYENTKKEMKKIVNQVNVYGYDLVTALKNTARETSSDKLSELLNGMSTIISGGGSLTEFLDKRAETLLFDYRLEREKYNKTSETFMDIYIGVVIAAPMIMTLLFVLMQVSQIGFGLSNLSLTVAMISIVALINILFLLFLHLQQPSY
jgi:pilus assembly protein TadC